MAKAAHATVPTTRAISIDITPSNEAQQGLALVTRAQALVVTDKRSHGDAKEFVQGAKKLKGVVEAHWKRITSTIDDTKRTLLKQKAEDVDPIESAISIVTTKVIDYENAEARRVREEEDRRRREAEAEARQRREHELAEQEAEALRLEAQSPKLSDREERFVSMVAGGLHTPQQAAKAAGYADPNAAAVRLVTSKKIVDAIASRKAAAAIREQAEAAKAAPLDVQPIAPVVSNTAKVAGQSSRTYYSAEVVDVEALIDAVVAGTVPRSVLMVNQPALNQAAKDGPDVFEKLFPGCRLVKRQGLAG